MSEVSSSQINMISRTLLNAKTFEPNDQKQRKAFALLLILGLHTLMLIAAFKAQHFSTIKQTSSALILRLIDFSQKTDARTANEEDDRKIPKASIAPTKRPAQQNIEKPAQSSSPLATASQIEKNKADETSDPALDPFATTQQKNTNLPSSGDRDRYRRDAGNAWKQIESELPVKRWLSTKKELSTMERFAQNLLEGAPAREIQTKEEMRPDGSRMTRVKTPRGEFCVVAPQPGRTYDVRGPEHRVMSCPVYF